MLISKASESTVLQGAAVSCALPLWPRVAWFSVALGYSECRDFFLLCSGNLFLSNQVPTLLSPAIAYRGGEQMARLPLRLLRV